MAEGGVSSGIAGRYATALFEIARDEGGIDALGRDVDALGAALRESADLRAFIDSPVVPRDEQQAAIGAIAERMGLGGTLANTLRLMASKRRLFVLPELLTSLRAMISEERGEVTAEVRAARALTDEQRRALSEALAANVGREVRIDASVDPSLIGGMVVRLGSKMIDTSIRARLDGLRTSMKEVG